MSLIAEGVETIEQMRELLKTGVDYLQGYLFAKPLSAAEITAAVQRFREPDGMFARATSGNVLEDDV
jgi:EAL domain-containing protein (putative c-di-GMP-specific phosphodiesterase class I)